MSRTQKAPPGKNYRNMGSAKLVDYETGDSRYITYVPDEIEEGVEAEYQEQTIIGRSAPIEGYSATGARTLSFSFTLFPTESGDPESVIKAEVFDMVMWLRSFVYPEYKGNFMFPPHRLQVIMGSFLNVVGIMKSAPVTWMKPFDPSTLFPHQAQLNFELTETVEDPFDRIRVQNYMGGMAGPIQHALRNKSSRSGKGTSQSIVPNRDLAPQDGIVTLD